MSISENSEAAPADSSLPSRSYPRKFIGQHFKVITTVGTSFALFGMQAVQGLLLARILGPEGRGQYGTCVLYAQAFTYVGLLGAVQAIARRAARNKDNLPQLSAAAIRLGLFTGFSTLIAVSGLAYLTLPEGKRYLLPLCMACTLMMPFEHIRVTLMAVDRGSGDFNRFNLNKLFGGIAFPLILLGIFFSGSGSVTLLALLTIVIPISGLAFRWLTHPHNSIGRPPEPSSKTLIAEGLPYAVGTTSTDLFNRLDSLLMLWFASFTIQGYYAASMAAANLMAIGPTAISMFTFNAGAVEHRPGLGKMLRLGAGLVAFQCVTALVFAAALPTLIGIVFGEHFLGAIPFALALVPAKAIGGVTSVAQGYLRGRNLSRFEPISRLLGASVMLGFVGFTFSQWGPMSIPFGAIAGHLAICVFIVGAVLMVGRTEIPPADKDQE